MKLHALAQQERVGRAILGDVPTVSQVGDDRLAAVTRIMPDQVIIHATLRPDAADGAGLLEVEMRQTVEYADTQHPASFRIWLRRSELELRTIEFVGYRRQRVGRPQSIRRGHRRSAAPEKTTAGPALVSPVHSVHCSVAFLCFFVGYQVLSIQNVSWRQTS